MGYHNSQQRAQHQQQDEKPYTDIYNTYKNTILGKVL